MKQFSRRLRVYPVALFALAALATVPGSFAGSRATRERVPLEASTMIIEYNASAEDIGIQFFLDSDGWTSVEIFDPRGHEVFSAEAEGRLVEQGGGTELFLESVEPPLDELSFEEFFERFPEGTYGFRAESEDGIVQFGKAEFSHDIPAGPVVTSPTARGSACANNVAIPVVVAWEPVTRTVFGDPIGIKGYEVIVENDDTNIDIHIPAAAGTSLTIPPEALAPGTDYLFEVLAIEEGGNQTITEGCFSTAR